MYNDPKPTISTNYGADLLTPGVQIEVSEEEALRLGAFEELALSEDDAWEANTDIERAE